MCPKTVLGYFVDELGSTAQPNPARGFHDWNECLDNNNDDDNSSSILKLHLLAVVIHNTRDKYTKICSCCLEFVAS